MPCASTQMERFRVAVWVAFLEMGEIALAVKVQSLRSLRRWRNKRVVHQLRVSFYRADVRLCVALRFQKEKEFFFYCWLSCFVFVLTDRISTVKAVVMALWDLSKDIHKLNEDRRTALFSNNAFLEVSLFLQFFNIHGQQSPRLCSSRLPVYSWGSVDDQSRKAPYSLSFTCLNCSFSVWWLDQGL